MKNFEIKVEGMMCGGCEARVNNAVGAISGVESVKADHVSGTVKISAKDKVKEETICSAIEDLGFTVIGR